MLGDWLGAVSLAAFRAEYLGRVPLACPSAATPAIALLDWPALGRVLARVPEDVLTPAATHGFGWHYDDEDVFIAQTVGVKDYYFRANTVTAGRAAPAEFAAFPQETAPLHAATLVAGDFLYIPARWWHMAICREDALSISVGVYPRPEAR